jgi:hypothetical protein
MVLEGGPGKSFLETGGHPEMGDYAVVEFLDKKKKLNHDFCQHLGFADDSILASTSTNKLTTSV